LRRLDMAASPSEFAILAIREVDEIGPRRFALPLSLRGFPLPKEEAAPSLFRKGGAQREGAPPDDKAVK